MTPARLARAFLVVACMSDPPSEDRMDEPRVTLVYCTYCNKTHAVTDDETPCAPGAWLDPEPVR